MTQEADRITARRDTLNAARRKATETLASHAKWLKGDGRGTQANLCGVDLRGANLSGVDLSGANLRGVNLFMADLSGADLSGADLSGASLHDANLYATNLAGANLAGADLTRAKLGSTVAVQTGPLGSRDDYLVTIWHPDWPAEQVTTGCWSGTLDELEIAVAKQHGGNQYSTQYNAAMRFHRFMLEIAQGSGNRQRRSHEEAWPFARDLARAKERMKQQGKP